MINTQVKQRIEIDVLKQNYQQQQRLFDRDLDQMKILLQQTEKSKQDANLKYALLSEKYNQKKIVDILDNQSFNKEGTYLFRTAKYAILGFDSKQRDQELPNLTKKVKKPTINEVDFAETFRVNTAVSYQQLENDQSKIPISEENNDNVSQSIINLMNNLEKVRHVYTTQERYNEYETIPPKPIKSEGRSASVTFDKDVQKENQKSLSLEPTQQILDEQIQYIERESEDFNQQQQQEAIDNQIDELLDDIQKIVGNNKQRNEYTSTTHKLQQQTEKKLVPLVVDKGNSFKPVHFIKEQMVVPDSRIYDKNVKDQDNLDRLISDLCN